MNLVHTLTSCLFNSHFNIIRYHVMRQFMLSAPFGVMIFVVI